MKSILVAALTTAALALTACGGASNAVDAGQAIKSERTQRNAKAAQKIITNCLAKTGFLRKSDRKRFYACVAPEGKQAAVKACAQKSIADHGVLTKGARRKVMADIERCIL